jgi:membrane protein implicated in regulation of membrane protease activity
MVAAIVIAVVLAVIVVGYVANAARLARRNNNLARRSPALIGRRGAEVDEQNRQVRR